jgi:phage N-6-adenine-methyltransferase
LARELQESKRREEELTRQVERIKSARSVHHSSQSDEYRTPQAVFDHYDRIFHFDVDVAATRKNAKCERFFTKADDGLKQEWKGAIWLNPPFSSIQKWMRKAYESAKLGAVIVALIPARTDTQWFRDYVSHAEIELLEGRIKFGGGASTAPFPSMVAVWRKRSARTGSRLTVTLSKIPTKQD